MSKPVYTAAMRKAVDAGIRRYGSLRALAQRLGVKSQAVSQWDEVPPRRVLAMEEATGVSRYELRPDIYGDEPDRGRPSRRSVSRLAAA
jgi:DNA-binding transcriptional regulator YdaS (Cro superfamily)